MMNLEESQNRELLPYGSPAFQRDESDGIDGLTKYYEDNVLVKGDTGSLIFSPTPIKELPL